MNSQPTVILHDGVLEGRVGYSRKGIRFFSFQGIPYAKPPVGKLRFKAPEPATPWDDVLNATEEPPQCYQRHIFKYEEVGGQEDCLFLNVYTPQVNIMQFVKINNCRGDCIQPAIHHCYVLT
ncbi:hypothetical protein ILUMI_07376 [Ignelater luminosus]|uniref:Carboxylesterase type B domain-containing protein n=1 Tax=Ignelater luminosus TaxID=2038154 RepID=A0A8K0GGD9_IGNLU|nr:hypothetical protein ILUMI_07376 [Ignelater luminosus]